MITMCISCGVGNQFFQFSTGYALSKKLGVGLQLDITDFSRANYRGYALGLFKGITEPTIIRSKPTIIERSLRYSPAIVSQVQDGDCLQGYFQTEKYFSQYKAELQEIFQPKQPLTERGITLVKKIESAGNSSVMLHIRRGDYSGSNRELSMVYYDNAIEALTKNVKNPVFFVFSDDPEWVKKNLTILYPWFLVSPGDKSSFNHIGREDEDLYAMSRCHHAIIANSSFSWAGAYLSPIPDSERTVIAPTPWFSSSEFDTRDIVPSTWSTVSSKSPKVLVALFSCDKLKYRSRAKLCVDSWKNQLPPNFTLEVFTGSSLGVDDNWGAVDKVKGIIRYALESGYDYLMKIDDDTEVRWDKVQVPKADYAGWMSPGINKEWPYDHCQGGCYWLSRAAMEILDKTPVDIDPTIRHMEDRWVCKYLHDAGIYPTDLLEFTMNPNWEGKIKHWKPNAVFNHFWSVLLQSEGLPKITASEKLRHIANPEYDFIGEGHQVAFRDGKIVELNEKGQFLKVIRDTRA